ncbi:histidine kinase dimerization/phosphoacceptor domain -containing protein [Fundidesulfovibrio terrae]|uniref:histidine kinase dimerization/phosphoacceptor domain -containing protein n=1 Tax=Fundidesulfovibrio terrae TaxID=2922866 RepID=UPI001FAFBB8D|nr:histidine kinase dimerization/phosphoacceptor domain -containing protein [Fundidesulfovibrio terrae]
MGILFSVLWTSFVYYLYKNALDSDERNVNDNALIEARIAYEKDITYRRWAAQLGGVYVEITDSLQPNPYLDVPERDVVTDSGKRLTLVNPAYMTRMVHGLMEQSSGAKGHITSLNPIRPGNAPRPWEAEALRSFEQGVRETYSVDQENGQPVFRYMHAMVTEKPCLKCHAKQGYREGDIRGGISVTLPLGGYMASLEKSTRETSHRYTMIFGAGALFILITMSVLVRHEVLRSKSMRDIRESEKKAWDSERRFKGIVEGAGDAIYITDMAGRILEANAEAEKQTGYSRDELLAMSARHLDTLFSTPLAVEGVLHDLSTCNKASFETVHLRKDGTDFPVDLRVVRLEFGEETVLIAIARDITERKLSDHKMESALREKEILLREIHHRVKNNLQIISSLLSLQEQRADNSPASDVLAESRGRIVAMAMIHEQLYISNDFSEIEIGSFLHRFLASIRSTYRSNSNIQIRIEACSATLMLDQAIPFSLILNELVTNAFKHAFPGGRSGSIEIITRLVDGDLACTVKDDGVGLPASFSLPETTTLGLQIVYLLVNQLRGEITVESSGGARFELRIPLKKR